MNGVDKQQIQAILRTGFPGLLHCRFLMLRVDRRDVTRPKAWLRELLNQSLVKSAVEVGKNKAEVKEAVLVGFSHMGLEALKIKSVDEFPFPTAFASGMAHPDRGPLLGDHDHTHWNWGDVAAPEHSNQAGVDIFVAHYCAGGFTKSAAKCLQPSALGAWGLQPARVIETCPIYRSRSIEPFGFKDGIAQPVIRGLRDPATGSHAGATHNDDENTIAPGEFILGQVNAYGEETYCPDVGNFRRPGRDFAFGRNGSYLVVREIRQDVAAFRSFEGKATVGVVEKFVGRTRSGDPLRAVPPDRPDETFGFRVDDLEGFACPRGAHIRRANPRDSLGWNVASGVAASKLHRLLRRGRVYVQGGECPRCSLIDSVQWSTAGAGNNAGALPPCAEGLMFMALNADLERQFEFIQQRWISSPKFGDMWHDADPLLGRSPRTFSMPDYQPIGTRANSTLPFTEVLGGGYFFLPSLSALDFVATP